MLSAKKKSKKLREVTQEKVVSLSDYRRLKRTKGNRILLVYTANDTLREKIKDKFSNLFQIHFVDTVTTFNNFLENYEIDFIFLDQRKQTWKAYDLCKTVRDNEKLSESSIIILTEQEVDKEEIIRSFKVGCDEVIKDNTDIDRVIRTMDYVLKS
jgi:DNA-binding response OmpR family regulator